MGHWYKKDGTPCHFIDGRDTTIKDARKLDLVPSVTSILNVVDKPGLTNYFINQHLEAAWGTLAKPWPWGTGEEVSYDLWCKEVRQLASEHSINAMNHGTEVHNLIEGYYRDGSNASNPFVKAVTAALKDVYGLEVGNCTPERSFATNDYGGCIDLSAEQLLLDFKRKDKWETKKNGKPKQMWYDNHVAQLAAYGEGLSSEAHKKGKSPYLDLKLVNVFIGPEAQVYIHEWTDDEAIFGLQFFNACLELWQLTNRFPS